MKRPFPELIRFPPLMEIVSFWKSNLTFDKKAKTKCWNLKNLKWQSEFVYFRYEGEWVDGLKQGKGTYTFGNGDIFEGTYENNRRHGPGFLKKTDGEHREENWKDDKMCRVMIYHKNDKSSIYEIGFCNYLWYRLQNVFTFLEYFPLNYQWNVDQSG